MQPELVKNLCQGIRDRRVTSGIILDHLLSIAKIQDDQIQKRLLKELIRGYVLLEKRVDALLKNTLPEVVANEIKDKGRFMPRSYDCTIFFSDIVVFTRMAEKIPGKRL
ncbi:MAG: hypothetical protein PHI99_06555, partial [Syntrophales bacterium]|nr:hypothetical protein [Syntrophales bacterium]